MAGYVFKWRDKSGKVIGREFRNDLSGVWKSCYNGLTIGEMNREHSLRKKGPSNFTQQDWIDWLRFLEKRKKSKTEYILSIYFKSLDENIEFDTNFRLRK